MQTWFQKLIDASSIASTEASLREALPGLVRELGFAKNSSELSKIVRRTLSGDEKAQLEQSIIQIYSALVMREEFLTY